MKSLVLLLPWARNLESSNGRAKQSAKFKLEYAQSTIAIKDQVAAVNGHAGRILEIYVSHIDLDLGSAAWFLTTKCPGVRGGLVSGSDEAWYAYVTCIDASPDDGRLNYWHKAVLTLGVKTS